MLKVTVQRASDLPDVDTFGKSDPYVKVSFQGRSVDLVRVRVRDFGVRLYFVQVSKARAQLLST